MRRYIPTNCGEPTTVITNENTREAYRRVVFYIKKDLYGMTCCTIDNDNVLKLYKATELPVKLTGRLTPKRLSSAHKSWIGMLTV